MSTQNATQCVVLLKQWINDNQFVNKKEDNTFCAIKINIVLLSIRQNECQYLKSCFNFKLVSKHTSIPQKDWILVGLKWLKCDTSVNFLSAAKQKRSANWKLIAVHVKKKTVRNVSCGFLCFYCKSFSNVSMHPNGLGSIVGVWFSVSARKNISKTNRFSAFRVAFFAHSFVCVCVVPQCLVNIVC